MKKIILILCSIILFTSCKKENFATFGATFSPDDAISVDEMNTNFTNLKEGDTIVVKFKSKIKAVCQKKGCWMTLDLGNNKDVFVKFKDYGFFVPKNAENETVIVNGKAFVSIESVDELKHYAKDAGKSQVAIDSIIAPKTTFSFLADGVLIQQ